MAKSEKPLNVNIVGKMVDKDLEERERVDEVINNNTVEAEGHFVTTLIFRREPFNVSDLDIKQSMVETRFIIYIDGQRSMAGEVGTEWK